MWAVKKADEQKAGKARTMTGSEMVLVLITLGAVALAGYLLLRRSGSHQDQELAALRGQLAQMANQSSELQRLIADQMAQSEGRMSTRLEQSLRDQNERTTKSLTGMAEKLAVITEANGHIAALSGQVTQLQNILSNKQARGSFGEVQLENLIRDALPDNAFDFQATLGNGRRVDCLLRLPNPPGPICIDAKFPLEAYRRLTAADNDAARDTARRGLEADVKKHIQDIAAKYIIPGETAESAILFLPSESVYAEINIQLPRLVAASRKARVYMAGPDNLMLILHTVRAILRDARMHEAAGLIQAQVDMMMQDVGRLEDRVGKLATHFAQAEKDISDIQTSTRKITSRGDKIAEIEVMDAEIGGADKPAQGFVGVTVIRLYSARVTVPILIWLLTLGPTCRHRDNQARHQPACRGQGVLHRPPSRPVFPRYNALLFGHRQLLIAPKSPHRHCHHRLGSITVQSANHRVHAHQSHLMCHQEYDKARDRPMRVPSPINRRHLQQHRSDYDRGADHCRYYNGR